MSDREIELKLVCTPAELERVRHAPAIARLKRGRASGRHLHSVYFDTDDLVLGDHGFALRLRRSGRTCLQTLKTDSGLSGDKTGALARDTGEYEARLPRGAEGPDLNKLPAGLKSRIQKLANGSPISPRLVSDIRRTVHCLETPDGDVIELALDKGALRAGAAGEIPVSEIELELKEGSPESLYRLALDLSDIANLRVGFESKSERGFALLRPRVPAAIKAETLALAPDTTLEDAYATILRHCLVHLTSNEAAAVEARLPEALHQMRVALRRARSALAIFRPAIGGGMADRLAGEAKWLANELGPARDLDVFVEEIVAPVTPRDAALSRLHARATAARNEAWDRALAALGSRRYTRFLLEYGLFLASRGWRLKRKAPRLARDFAVEALDRRLASVVKLGRDIETLDLEDRHELRKRLKKFRYGLHFLSSLFEAGKAKPYIRHLSQLQDVFGGLNDVATAHAILDGPLAALPNDEGSAGAATRIFAWSEKRAAADWKGALRLWRRFREAEPFWRD